MNLKYIICAAACALLLGGCKAQQKGDIRIAAISPDTATLLRPGERVQLRAEIEYKLRNFDAATDLLVRRANGLPILLAADILPRKRGSGTICVTRSFIVPETTEIVVDLRIRSEGGKALPSDSRIYRIMQLPPPANPAK